MSILLGEKRYKEGNEIFSASILIAAILGVIFLFAETITEILSFSLCLILIHKLKRKLSE